MDKSTYKRKIYLQDTPRQEALAHILNNFSPERKIESISSTESLGRVTALPVFANMSSPHYHASAMDGIAVKAETTFAAHEQNPVQLKLGEDFVYVNTGNGIPSPYNAVIMIEYVDELDENTIEIIEPASPWQHIRPIGEDIVQEEMLFSQGHKIRPVDMGVLLASQRIEVPVMKKPIVCIIPTGDELVFPDGVTPPEKLVEFNGTVMANYVREWGGEPHLHCIVKDRPDEIRVALLEAVEHSDLVILNAGSSAGSGGLLCSYHRETWGSIHAWDCHKARKIRDTRKNQGYDRHWCPRLSSFCLFRSGVVCSALTLSLPANSGPKTRNSKGKAWEKNCWDHGSGRLYSHEHWIC